MPWQLRHFTQAANTPDPLPVAPRQLREYQAEAVQAVVDYWSQDRERYTPVVVLPTGTGKSTVIASLAAYAADMGLRVLLLAHRRELLDQMVASVHAVAPGRLETGVVQGDRDNPHAPVVAASFQTMAASPSRMRSLGHRDVILVDEMHHSTAPSYLEVLAGLGVTGDGPRPTWACGFTATASRADGGLGQVWDSVVYERSLAWAIQSGYLVRPRGLTVVLPDLDLSSVTVRAGDYAAGELETVMASSVDTTVAAMHTHAAGRTSIVFAAGVDHAQALAAALTASGVPAAAVTGDMSTEDREVVYQDYRSGRLQAMVTVQVLTEGADFPMCDTVVMARPTRSQTLYSQMVGRAVRLHEGKTDALVLDLAGTVRDMSLVTVSSLDPTLPSTRVSPDSAEDPGQDEPEPRPARQERIGVASLEEIDLLATSSANWLTTPAGVRFLDGQDGVLVFLWPPHPDQAGAVSVGLMHNPPHQRDGWLETGLDLESATVAAETAASLYGTLPERSAPWRSRSTPSDGQVRLARALGVPMAELKTRARLSDDISTVKAAARLDAYTH
jgi:superfamily II DNA or RNA helicase